MTKPPPGLLAKITTKNDGRFYFLTPVVAKRYNPAIRIHEGGFHPAYVMPGLLDRVGDQIDVILPEVKERELKLSNARWIESFRDALGLMKKVWDAVGGDPALSDQEQEWLAKGLTAWPRTAFLLLKSSGVMGQEGVPKGAESYVKTLMALLYWGQLWKLRTQSKKQGMDWISAAVELNRLCHQQFPPWKEWGWSDFTARTLRGVILESRGQECELPD